MGCEPVLDLSATFDEAVSIICTFVDKTLLSTFWGKLMYVSYTTDWPGVSVGHPIGALAIDRNCNVLPLVYFDLLNWSRLMLRSVTCQ